MDSLGGGGPSSDVAVLGHDVSVLLAMPQAWDTTSSSSSSGSGSSGDGSCGATVVEEMRALVRALEEELVPTGGALRAWSCLPACLPSAKLLSCSLYSRQSGGPLLALALRLPPTASPAAVVRTLEAVSPEAAQLEVRTDLRVPPGCTALGSVTGALLHVL